jgi:hypothetical protein
MLYKITQGDIYRPISITVLLNDVPYDCTGATAYFYITHTVTGHVYRESCLVDHSTLTFTFTPSSTSESGVYRGNYIIEFPDGTAISMPNEGYIDVVIKQAVPPMGAFGEIYSLEFMKIENYDTDRDGIVDYAEKLSYGIRGKSYDDIHGELLTHTNIPTAHHTNVNDPTTHQKAALDASLDPSSTNKYITNNDSRLTNARSPTTHASNHSSGSNDPISVENLTFNANDANNVSVVKHGLCPALPSTDANTKYFCGDGTWKNPTQVIIDTMTRWEEGVLSTGTSFMPHLVVGNQTISSVKGFIQNLPSGANILIDIRKNNPVLTTNSIFINDSPQAINTNFIATNGVYQFDFTSAINVGMADCLAGDVLYIIITQVGSTNAGTGFYIKVMF